MVLSGFCKSSDKVLLPFPLLTYSVSLLGMGLNLSIGRIIFSALDKFDGITHRRLTDAEIKQIAGRAGRFKGKYEVSQTKEKQRMEISK